MNATDTTSGGYAGSEMHTKTLPAVATNLQKALGSHLLKRRVILSNTVNSSGVVTGTQWADAYVTLLSEIQVYGSITVSRVYAGDIGEASQQLPIFNFINFVRFGRNAIWLRTVNSTTGFAVASGNGIAAIEYNASRSIAVRPLIIIG